MDISRAVKISQGLSIILIVLFHANDFLGREGWSFRGSSVAIFLLSPVLLSLFFFCAGQSFSARGAKNLDTYVVNRSDGYIWILIVWNIIYIPMSITYSYLHTSAFNSASPHSSDGLFTLSPRDVIRFIIFPNNVTWFVHGVLIYILAVYFAIRACMLQWLLIITIVLDIIFWYLAKFELYVNFQYLEIFLAGYIFGSPLIEWLGQARAITRLLLIISYVAVCCLAFALLPLDMPVLSIAIRVAGLSSLICASFWIDRTFLANVLIKISNFVLPIYLMHLSIIYLAVFAVLIGHLETSSIVVKALSTPVLGCVCLAFCYFTFRYVRSARLLFFRPRFFRPIGWTASIWKRFEGSLLLNR
jgi:hypothetical protein